MAGYPKTEQQATCAEERATLLEGDWILADPGNVLNGTLESNAQMLSVEAALAFPGIPKVASKIDAVISVVAPTSQSTDRAPIRLVAVLDKSGSMQGEKMKLVIETVKFMLQHLTERDALGLVAFDTQTCVLAPLTRCNLEGRLHLEAVIGRVKAGSQTNLSGGLLKGLDLHRQAERDLAETPGVQHQRICFGNTYRRLPEQLEDDPQLAPPPAGASRVHEWTMELRTESAADAQLIQKVVYKLHHTFQNPLVEVVEPPFRLTKTGWGLFKIHADMHLHDGRVLPLEHELCFDKAEHFRSILMPLQSAPQEPKSSVETEDDQAVVRSTFLFTDGMANCGITNCEELCKAVGAMLGELGRKDCTISTFGFGKDHSEELMRSIADVGKGTYCFIENTDSIGDAFGEAFGGLLSVTHQNVRLTLNLAPEVGLLKLRTSYSTEGPVRGENGWQTMSIDVGDLYAEERRDIPLELSLPESSVDGPATFGKLHARAFSVLTKSTETTEPVDLLVERLSEVAEGQCQTNPQVERHFNRCIASDALNSARTLARRGDLTQARRCLDTASDKLRASALAVQGCPLTLALLADLQECLTDLRDECSYACSGSKKMAYMQMAHERQRTCGGASTGTYCNTMAFTMKSAAAERVKTPASAATL